ncbi:hypothetical protein OAF52_01050 [bacterium]|nr:hypothetical protein [bacterium]
MVVMLSQNSTGSDNIVKEVMLASENKKKNLPVHLQPTEILRKHGDKTGAELKAEGK